ncbi:hypothetical protein [Thermomonospora cellulosilytica]|uniref:Uncharacterized protein n=1 Tax=Thermomonospora cellulosilytica TaxID=1411118 RepID=A0A7W3MSM2_9ACTN|nr:hypothetical protein [Thermomonospora cellulosilytica]MBA9001147.1 hypothetical protein [Thermomonospora cellulosilytica]
MDFSPGTVDEETGRRLARANAEALRDELTEALRTRLAAAGWQGRITLEEDPEWFPDDGRPGYHGYRLNTPAWDEAGGAGIEIPGVPLEVLRAEPESEEGPIWVDEEPKAWDGAITHLTEEAARWEMYQINIRAFLADVVAAGGPPDVAGADLRVDVDAAGGNCEYYWVPVHGRRIRVGMHSEVDGRESGQEVCVAWGDWMSWADAVRDFVRRAERIAAHPDVVARPDWNGEF